MQHRNFKRFVNDHASCAMPENMAERQADQLRCPCGSLLARQVPGGIELKCKRCKRVTVIPWQQDRAT